MALDDQALKDHYREHPIDFSRLNHLNDREDLVLDRREVRPS